MRLYHHITWKEISAFEHKKSFTEEDGIHVYSEDEFREGGPYAEEAVSSRYVMQELPIKLNPKSVSKQDTNPAASNGVSLMAWSYDSRYLATKNDNIPNCVYLWDMATLKQYALLIHLHPVRHFEWSPSSIHLAITTNSA